MEPTHMAGEGASNLRTNTWSALLLLLLLWPAPLSRAQLRAGRLRSAGTRQESVPLSQRMLLPFSSFLFARGLELLFYPCGDDNSKSNPRDLDSSHADCSHWLSRHFIAKEGSARSPPILLPYAMKLRITLGHIGKAESQSHCWFTSALPLCACSILEL